MPPQEAPRNFIGFLLTEEEARAQRETVEAADKLAKEAETSAMNEAASVMERRRIEEALREAENGNPAKLDALLADPAVSNRVKERVTIASEAAGVRDSLAGQDPAQTRARLRDLRDRIGNSANINPADKQRLRDQLTRLEDANQQRILAQLLARSQPTGGGLPPGIAPGFYGGLAVGIDAPAEPRSAFAIGNVTLINPSSTGGGVAYVLNEQWDYRLDSGSKHDLPARHWTISFDSGGSRGQRRYTLAPGAYEFYVSDGGWDLRSKSYSVTIDNSHVAGDFHYLLNGEPATVRAGERREHQLKQAPQIAFDRGDGQTVRRELSEGAYQVGIDVQRRVFELYSDLSIQSVSRNEDSFFDRPAF